MKIVSLTIFILIICNPAFAEEEYVHFGREIPLNAKYFDKAIKEVHEIDSVRTIVLNEINKKTKISEVKKRIHGLLSEGVFQNPSNNPSKAMWVSFEAIVFYKDGTSMKIVEWDNGWHYSLWTSYEPNAQYTFHPK